jgi:hypothetical protein
MCGDYVRNRVPVQARKGGFSPAGKLLIETLFCICPASAIFTWQDQAAGVLEGEFFERTDAGPFSNAVKCQGTR